MHCKLSEQSYQWKNDDGSYGVGKLVMAIDGNNIYRISRSGGVLPDFGGESLRRGWVLLQHSCAGPLEFVQFSKLSVYPASPIEQPKT